MSIKFQWNQLKNFYCLCSWAWRFGPTACLCHCSICIVCASQFVIVSIEQSTYINFCVLLHKTNAETLTLLEEALAEEAMIKIQVYVLRKRFYGGRDIIKDNVRATATDFPRNQNLPRDTSKGKVMLEVYSRRSYCYETMVRRNSPSPPNAERRKRPENTWFLMHDNAPAHRAIMVQNFLARHNMTA
ncbi:hypothetical protein C0J52_25940 [Blattella germanica]|nr:hypothetical protein C0J52_25940 [Blattella germanica]